MVPERKFFKKNQKKVTSITQTDDIFVNDNISEENHAKQDNNIMIGSKGNSSFDYREK